MKLAAELVTAARDDSELPGPARLFERACDGGLPLGCSNLGVLYLDGKGTARDPARARELFRRACDGDDMFGCYDLGVMVAGGIAGPRDPAQAEALFRLSCDGGYDDACDKLDGMATLGCLDEQGVFRLAPCLGR